MMETIVVLLIFFMLVVIGIIFWVKVSKSNIDIQQQENRQLQAIEIAQRVLFLPELQCSSENIIESDCIDLLKLQSAENVMINNEVFYYDKLGFSHISVNEIYPNNGNSWILYDNVLDSFTQKIQTNMPVTIYSPASDTKSFGILSVEVYTK